VITGHIIERNRTQAHSAADRHASTSVVVVFRIEADQLGELASLVAAGSAHKVVCGEVAT
jgi:hypothetical protein